MFTAEETTAIVLSLRVAGMAVVCAAPFAVATAYILARWNFRGKIFFDALVHLPLLMPPVLTGYALLIVLGRQGETAVAQRLTHRGRLQRKRAQR